MTTIDELQLRDPYVVAVPDDGRYLLLGSTDADIWKPPGVGFDGWWTEDLVHLTGPVPLWRPQEDFWSPGEYWAPEVHQYTSQEGTSAWYLLATFGSRDSGGNVIRGSQVFRAACPEGPYEPWSRGPITPAEWPCLDATLYVDPSGHPWTVFCHEWIDARDGTVCAQRLSPDLRGTTGPVTTLFAASESGWAEPLELPPHKQLLGTCHVTDGPFLHRLTTGELIMVWSSFTAEGYALGQARSTSGDVLGPWEHHPEPLVSGGGGHGMVFRDLSGQLRLTWHSPNRTPYERTQLAALEERSGWLSRHQS